MNENYEDEYINLLSRFSSHKTDEAGQIRMKMIRQIARSFAKTIDKLCPEGKEKTTALTHLTFVMYLANAAISNPYPMDINDLDEKESEL